MNISNVRYLINCGIIKNDIAKHRWKGDNSFKWDLQTAKKRLIPRDQRDHVIFEKS